MGCCVRSLAEESATAERARERLAPAGYSAEQDSSPQEAHSEQAGCPAGLQAAHWRADLVFRRSAHSLAGCPVGPHSASPVSLEAVWAVACARLAEESATAEQARETIGSGRVFGWAGFVTTGGSLGAGRLPGRFAGCALAGWPGLPAFGEFPGWFPVGPHLASPVSPEAVRAVACARLAEESATAERAGDDWLRPGIRLDRIRHHRRLI